MNLYGFVGNGPVNAWDLLSLKCVCGPDITNALRKTLKAIGEAFRDLSPPKREEVCSNLVGAASWDIQDLKVRAFTDACGERDEDNSSECKKTVTIKGQ